MGVAEGRLEIGFTDLSLILRGRPIVSRLAIEQQMQIEHALSLA